MKQWFSVAMAGLVLAGLPAHAESHEHEVARIRTELAAGYFAHAQYGIALDDINDALNAMSDYAPAYDVRGLIYMEMHQFDKADTSFKRALSLAPDDYDSNHNYGWFLCTSESKYKESLPYFVHATENPLYQTPAKSFQWAGLCAVRAKMYDKADQYLHEADRIEPNDPLTTLGFAELAYGRGEYANAKSLLDQEAKIGRTDAETLWLMIRVDRKLGDPAANALEADLTKRFPQSEEAHEMAQGHFD